MIDTPVEDFLKGPVGRFTWNSSAFVWCESRALCGLYFWGRPTAQEILYVARIAEAYPKWMDASFDVIVDGREVAALDGEALAIQMAWLLQHGAELLKHARIWSIVAEDSAVARTAAAMSSLGGASTFRITTNARDTYHSVHTASGADLGARVDEIAAQIRGVPRELLVIRALLRRRVDAKVEDAAKELGVSTRSLQRKLESHGSSFHIEVVAARIAIACELLRSTDLKVAAVGARLQISERAVTMLLLEQTGLTPAAWRTANRRERG